METFRTIPAIPTVYRGNRMRSRTEAKAARLLDDLRIPWAYEPRTFSRNRIKGTGYKPDFQLWPAGSHRWYVEIKPGAIWIPGSTVAPDLVRALDKMAVIWHTHRDATLALWITDPRSPTFGYVLVRSSPSVEWEAFMALGWLKTTRHAQPSRPWWRRWFGR